MVAQESPNPSVEALYLTNTVTSVSGENNRDIMSDKRPGLEISPKVLYSSFNQY